MLDAQMSAPVAAGLKRGRGRARRASFSAREPRAARSAPAGRAHHTEVDAECERLYPGRRSGVVRLFLADGSRFERRVLDPKGEGDDPMSDEDLKRKFTVNCTPVVGAEKCTRVLDAIWSFDAAQDLTEITT